MGFPQGGLRALVALAIECCVCRVCVSVVELLVGPAEDLVAADVMGDYGAAPELVGPAGDGRRRSVEWSVDRGAVLVVHRVDAVGGARGHREGRREGEGPEGG